MICVYIFSSLITQKMNALKISQDGIDSHGLFIALLNNWSFCSSKIIRALAIMLAIFLRIDLQLLSPNGCYINSINLKVMIWQIFHKVALGLSFLLLINAGVWIILSPTVQISFWNFFHSKQYHASSYATKHTIT